MIKGKISGFDISGLLDFFKSYNGFSQLNWWNEWILHTTDESGEFNKLFAFIYTNYMMRIKSNLSVSVMLEFINKSEAMVTIISTGGQEGLFGISYGSEEHCEQKIYKALKEVAQSRDWIVKDNLVN